MGGNQLAPLAHFAGIDAGGGIIACATNYFNSSTINHTPHHETGRRRRWWRRSGIRASAHNTMQLAAAALLARP